MTDRENGWIWERGDLAALHDGLGLGDTALALLVHLRAQGAPNGLGTSPVYLSIGDEAARQGCPPAAVVEGWLELGLAGLVFPRLPMADLHGLQPITVTWSCVRAAIAGGRDLAELLGAGGAR